MSVSVDFHGAADGSDGPFDLASNGSWAAFASWAGGLDVGRFPKLRALANDGEARDSAALAAELTESGADKIGGAVSGVAEALADLLGPGDADETTQISD